MNSRNICNMFFNSQPKEELFCLAFLIINYINVRGPVEEQIILLPYENIENSEYETRWRTNDGCNKKHTEKILLQEFIGLKEK